MGILFTKLYDFFASKKLEICMVGLENSGKTTLLNVLSLGHAVETLPTVGLNVKVMTKEGINMKVWDLGGQPRFRDQWPKYTANANVILYVVDSHDVEKLPEAKKELHALLEDTNLKGIPVLIVLNKIDLDQKYTKTEISKHLNLDYLNDNPWAVVPISALRGTNIVEVVDWLVVQTP